MIADAGVGWHGTSGARHYMSPDEFAREQARVVAAFGSPYRLTRPLKRKTPVAGDPRRTAHEDFPEL